MGVIARGQITVVTVEDGAPTPVFSLLPAHSAISRTAAGVAAPAKTSCRVKLNVAGKEEIVGVDAPIEYPGRNLLVGGRSMTLVSGGNYNYRVFSPSIPLMVGKTYYISADVYVLEGSVSVVSVFLYNNAITAPGGYVDCSVVNGRIQGALSIKESVKSAKVLIYAGEAGATGGNSIRFENIMLSEKKDHYSVAPEDYLIKLNGAAYTAGTDYTISASDTAVKWELFGSGAQVVDIETVPVLKDGKDAGINLLLDTQNPHLSNTSIWNMNDGASFWGKAGNFSAVKVTTDWGRLWQQIALQPDRTYTFSCWMKRDTALETGVTLVNLWMTDSPSDYGLSLVSSSHGQRFIAPTTFTRVYFTFKTSSTYSDTAIPRLEPYCSEYQTKNPCLVVYGYQLEEGERMSDWTANPADYNRIAEFRYAKNNSATTPPTIGQTSEIPSGWSITVPAIASGEYLWESFAIKTNAGALVQNWSTPVRKNGEDGAPGESSTTYSILPSSAAVKKMIDGDSITFIPHEISATAKVSVGNGLPTSTAKGAMFYKPSSGTEQAYSGTITFPTNATWDWIDFNYYDTVAKGTLLATSRVVISKDVDLSAVNIVSRINQSSEKIAISAEKIELIGNMAVNGKFTVDLAGNATMADLKLNRLTGNSFKMTDGTIDRVVGNSFAMESGSVGMLKVSPSEIESPLMKVNDSPTEEVTAPGTLRTAYSLGSSFPTIGSAFTGPGVWQSTAKIAVCPSQAGSVFFRITLSNLTQLAGVSVKCRFRAVNAGGDTLVTWDNVMPIGNATTIFPTGVIRLKGFPAKAYLVMEIALVSGYDSMSPRTFSLMAAPSNASWPNLGGAYIYYSFTNSLSLTRSGGALTSSDAYSAVVDGMISHTVLSDNGAIVLTIGTTTLVLNKTSLQKLITLL